MNRLRLGGRLGHVSALVHATVGTYFAYPRAGNQGITEIGDGSECNKKRGVAHAFTNQACDAINCCTGKRLLKVTDRWGWADSSSNANR